MSVYKKKEMCTGCSACSMVCPQKCIQMSPDKEGFLYPVIDEQKCIHCGKCMRVCHTYLHEKHAGIPKLYSYTNPNPDVLNKSSSGGTFRTLAYKILAKGGYVSGAVYDASNHFVRHIVSDDPTIVDRMCGSKYVQSDMGNCYSQIKRLLENGSFVLFTGTPCQVLGLKRYLGGEHKGLYTVDIICHSVPSPLIFDKYVELLETADGSIREFSFRDKKLGWEEYSIHYKTDSAERYLPHRGNQYMNGFLDGLYHRDSCNQCPVKTRVDYQSDLTIGDFWGVQTVAPEIYNPNGVSAVLANTPEGLELISDLNLKPCDFQVFVKKNPKYRECAQNSEKSSLFWNVFEKKGLKAAFHAVYRIPLKIRIKTKIKKVMQKLNAEQLLIILRNGGNR